MTNTAAQAEVAHSVQSPLAKKTASHTNNETRSAIAQLEKTISKLEHAIAEVESSFADLGYGTKPFDDDGAVRYPQKTACNSNKLVGKSSRMNHLFFIANRAH